MALRDTNFSPVQGRRISRDELSRMAAGLQRVQTLSGPGMAAGGMGYHLTPTPPTYIFAQITAKDSSTPPKYTWQQILPDGAGGWTVPADGASGSTAAGLPAYEAAGYVLSTFPAHVTLYYTATEVFFFAPADGNTAVAQVTTTIPALSGLVPGLGVVTTYCVSQPAASGSGGSGGSGGSSQPPTLVPNQTGVQVYSTYYWPFTVGQWVQLVKDQCGNWFAIGPPSFPFVTNVCPDTASGSGSGSGGCNEFAGSNCCPGSCWPNTLHLTVTGPCAALNGTYALSFGGGFWTSPDFTYGGQTVYWFFECVPNQTPSGMYLALVQHSGNNLGNTTVVPTCSPPAASGTIAFTSGPCNGQTINWSIG